MQMLSSPSALPLELVLRLVGFIVKGNMFFSAHIPCTDRYVIECAPCAPINKLHRPAEDKLSYPARQIIILSKDSPDIG